MPLNKKPDGPLLTQPRRGDVCLFFSTLFFSCSSGTWTCSSSIAWMRQRARREETCHKIGESPLLFYPFVAPLPFLLIDQPPYQHSQDNARCCLPRQGSAVKHLFFIYLFPLVMTLFLCLDRHFPKAVLQSSLVERFFFSPTLEPCSSPCTKHHDI